MRKLVLPNSSAILFRGRVSPNQNINPITQSTLYRKIIYIMIKTHTNAGHQIREYYSSKEEEKLRDPEGKQLTKLLHKGQRGGLWLPVGAGCDWAGCYSPLLWS